jgi:transcriptional regulator with XRE-family HTH domain
VTLDGADWQHLGRCLREARAGEPRHVIAKRADVSRTQIQRYEEGHPHKVIPDKLYKLARFYGWAPGSVRRVLAGGEPEYLPALPAAPEPTPRVRARMQAVLDDPESTEADRVFAWYVLTGRHPTT